MRRDMKPNDGGGAGRNHHQTRPYRTYRFQKARNEYRHLSKPGPSGLYLAQFLEVGEETIAIPGVVPIGRAAAAEALEWDLADFDRMFSELETSGIAVADWRARLVFLPAKLQEEESAPNSLQAVVTFRRAFDRLPDCELKARIGSDLRALVERRSATMLEVWDAGVLPKATDRAIGEPTHKATGERSGVQVTGNRDQGMKKSASSATGRFFQGRLLRMSQSQHDIVFDALGPSTASVDFQLLYAAADADYIRDGEPRDVLADLKQRARAAADTERIRLSRERARARQTERDAEDARLEAAAAESRRQRAAAQAVEQNGGHS